MALDRILEILLFTKNTCWEKSGWTDGIRSSGIPSKHAVDGVRSRFACSIDISRWEHVRQSLRAYRQHSTL